MAVRLVVEATWENDRDQFLFPYDTWRADEEFKTDCLTYAIFSNKNNVRSSDGLNHWQPFTEEDLGLTDELPCHFMTGLFAGTTKQELTQRNVFGSEHGNAEVPLLFSAEAQAVFNAGKKLWRYYFQQPDADLNASYYDIRQYFQGTKTDKKGKEMMNSASGDDIYMELHAALRKAHNKLADKIRPKVYEHGFLK